MKSALTHGVVSGEPDFFRRAFGASADEFERILLLPHHFIFNRDWYDRFGGRGEYDDYTSLMARLTPSLRTELLAKLSSCDPAQWKRLRDDENDPQLRRILEFYVPISKDREREIWASRKALPAVDTSAYPPEDELVEDAGLADDGLPLEQEIAA